MKLSAAGIDFIQTRERYSLKPHWDPVAQVWDIGFGHRFKPGEPRVPITMAECYALFDLDVRYREDSVNHLVRVPLSQQQFDAMVSFVYNVGHAALETSTKVLPALNGAQFDKTVVAMLEWNHSLGKKVRGVCSRRYDEVMVFVYGDYTPC